MPTEAELIVEKIYEAAVLPELWPDVLKGFARYSQCDEAVLIAARSTNFLNWICSSPSMNDLVIAHANRAEENRRTQRLMSARHMGFLRDMDVFKPEEIEADPLFQNFLIPNGYGTGVATHIQTPSGEDIILHAERAFRTGPVSDGTVAELDKLRPHFARATLLSTRLNLERAMTTAKTLALLGLPAAVLDSAGRALAINELLDALMPKVVLPGVNRLSLSDPDGDRLLEAAFGAFRYASVQIAISSIPIRAREDRPPYIVHLVPIVGAANDVFSGGSAILLVTPVIPASVPTANVLQGLFDLTPAEARLAALVAAGHRPQEAAAQLKISTETARTVLKRLFAKTGTSRQAELVSLLAGTR